MYVMNSDNTLLVSDVSIENATIMGGRLGILFGAILCLVFECQAELFIF